MSAYVVVCLPGPRIEPESLERIVPAQMLPEPRHGRYVRLRVMRVIHVHVWSALDTNLLLQRLELEEGLIHMPDSVNPVLRKLESKESDAGPYVVSACNGKIAIALNFPYKLVTHLPAQAARFLE